MILVPKTEPNRPYRISYHYMIIVLHGENSFLTKRKRDEVVREYRAKHPKGLSFYVFEDGIDIDEFKKVMETTSLFDIKKLVVCKGALEKTKEIEPLVAFLKMARVKEDKDTVVVFSESGSLVGAKNKNIAWLLEAPSIVQESKSVAAAKLSAWLILEAQRLGGDIDHNAVASLLSICGDDLWRLSNELSKLVAYDKRVTKKNVLLLVPSEPEGEIFEALSALSLGDQKTAARQFRALLKKDSEWTKLFAMIVFQFRSVLKVRSLLDEGYEGPALAKKSGMHPFALKKTIPHAKKYTADALKEMYRRLVNIDFALKTGQLTFEAAVEDLIARS